MQFHQLRDQMPQFTAALLTVACLMHSSVALGQPTITSSGLGTTVSTTDNLSYTVNGGTQAGTNLFHSFGEFSVPTSGSAIFNGPASTTNVFSRVTGGQPSTIDGLINSRAAMPSANFFLINPAGVMFGPGASIDVGGTFHASSSERITFPDGREFSGSTAPSDVLLLTAPPQAFGFLGTAEPIRTDGTLGTVVDSDGGGNYLISGGTYKQTNLFHSFDAFSLLGGVAIFEGLPATQNVISRVTGGDQSIIDGFLSTRAGMSPMLAANFFFINPAGLVFGPGAFLDIGGSVYFSTADRVTFPDQVFSAAPQVNDLQLLSSAPAQGFGFLDDVIAGIEINGAQLFVDPHDGVAGRTLSLVGGDVNVLGGGVLFAPGGAVQIVSVGSPGTVNLAAPDLGASSFARLGRVTIGDASVVGAGDASDLGLPGPGGTVMIRSGQLVLENGALVFSQTADSGAPALGVDIQAREFVVVDTGSSIQTLGFGSDDASGILIATGALTVSGGGVIESSARSASSTGKSGGIDIQVVSANVLGGGAIRSGSNFQGGNISLVASGAVTLSGPTTEILTGVQEKSGNAFAGDISIMAMDVALSDHAQLRSGTVFLQGGKKLSVTATNTVNISGLAGIVSQAFSGDAGGVEISAAHLAMDAGFINASTLGAGGAGSINVKAGSVSLVNGAQIASSTQLAATNQAGNIAIEADSVMISGRGPATGSVGSATFTNDRSSGVFSTSSGSGRAGSIRISTPSLTLADLGKISVAATGSGNAGTIFGNMGSATISGGARIDSSTSAGGLGGAIDLTGPLIISGTGSGLFSTASGTGDAGSITINSPTLSLTDGGRIAVTATAAGDAGTVVANVGSFNIAGGGRVDSSTSAGGEGGSITVNGTLAISGTGSGLFSTASGAGRAGAISATGPSLTVTGGGTIDSSTTGVGAGGAINISAASVVEISGGGSVKADSLGAGNTGSITIAAGDRILMEAGSISTRAATSDGGNITLMAPNVIRLNNSQVTTSVQSGTGTGGNIFIDPEFVILQGTAITANAFGGPGGNITIVANNFIADATSSVQASSALSTPGSVEIRSPENNLASDLAQLPKELVDASRLMQSACSARRAGVPSSFTVAGRGGVPVDPDGYLPSYSMSEAPAAAAPRAGYGFMLAMAGLDCWR